MILKPDNPYYKDLPGLSVLIGGMWIMNLSYWGFNQYIIQRALAAKDTREAQKGIVLASFLKLLMPVLVVLPGIAASVLAPHLEKPDQAYPYLMTLAAAGVAGSRLCGADCGDHRVDGIEDQFDRDHLHD
jgi:SSS family solute:Na+ symporter